MSFVINTYLYMTVTARSALLVRTQTGFKNTPKYHAANKHKQPVMFLNGEC